MKNGTGKLPGFLRNAASGGVLLSLVAAFGSSESIAERPAAADVTTVAGWTVSTLDEEGLDARQIAELADFLVGEPHRDFKGLAIARNGKLVYEGYFNGHDRDALVDIRSATKSLTSILAGVAIEEGLLDGVDTPMLPALWPEYAALEDAAQKKTIRLEDLLTMSSGLDADDDRPESPGSEDYFYESSDWLRFILGLPMIHSPGKHWAYASANTFLLGAMIEEAAGVTLASYAEDGLFDALGVTDYHWAESPKGRTVGQGNLSLRLVDMTKFGQLFLDHGQWAGEQLISKDWVQASIVGRYPVPWEHYDEYGYGWYLHTQAVHGRDLGYYFASGNGGNKIYVVPDERLVVAIQSEAYNTNYGQRRSLRVLTSVLEALPHD